LRSSRSSEEATSKEKLRLSIEKLVYGGYGISRLSGKVAFVRYAAPKELVDVQVIEEKKDYLQALVKDVVIPSRVRRDPLCPYYGTCGGCQLQHIDYNAQVESKESILRETLRRVARVEDPPLLGSVPSRQELFYRVRVQFKVKGGKLGFFRWNAREVVDIKECPVAHPRINELLPALKECAAHIRELQEIQVTYSPLEDSFLVKFITPTEIDKDLLNNLKEDCLPKDVVGVGDYSRLRTLTNRRYWIGKEYLFMKAGRWTYRVSADSFFQVNHTLWEDFIGSVMDGAAYRKAVELHCGVGFFTLPLSERGNFIEGSDMSPSAIDDAIYNAKLNGRENVVFVKSDSRRHLKNRGGEVIDLLLLDPPRGGLQREELELIVKNRPERVIYISCNPTTLARDLRVLLKGGYTLEGTKLLDMFPQTYHVESINFLRLQE